MKNYCRKSPLGLTLIELLVVVAILAILSAIGAPSFISMLGKFRVSSEITSFAGDLQFARSEALKRGVPVIMCPSSDKETCIASSTWNSGKTGSVGWIVGQADEAGTNIVQPVLRVQMQFDSKDTLVAAAGTTQVTWTRDGFAQGLPAAAVESFQLHTTPINSKATKCVALNKAGRQITQPYTDPALPNAQRSNETPCS